MTRRRRTLIAIPFVLAWAAYAYVRDPYLPGDLTSQENPFDADNGRVIDPKAAVRRFDGRRMVITGHLVVTAYEGTSRKDFKALQYALVPLWTDDLPPPEVALRAGWLPPYSRGTLRAAGRLHVNVKDESGVMVAVYTLDLDWIEVPGGRPISMWPPVVVGPLATTAAGVGVVRLARRRRRAAAGRCVECGYDLRATPARCPECGRPANVPGLPA